MPHLRLAKLRDCGSSQKRSIWQDDAGGEIMPTQSCASARAAADINPVAEPKARPFAAVRPTAATMTPDFVSENGSARRHRVGNCLRFCPFEQKALRANDSRACCKIFCASHKAELNQMDSPFDFCRCPR